LGNERVITVFGSSRPREGDADYEEARALGRVLALNGFVVCSGGYGGVMAAVSRGTKEAGGKTLGVTADFFTTAKLNPWIDEEIRMKSWQERLFELVERGHGFVACKGGTGTLVELAVVWEMLNKSVMAPKPFVAMGFWSPILECVREVEVGHPGPWGEANGRLVHTARGVDDAVSYLRKRIMSGSAAANMAIPRTAIAE